MASRILISDDHAAMRRMLRLLVEAHAGWVVCGEAKNGEEAVAKAAELNPDLIILDLAMPVMDGIRASRAISAAMPTVPILMHTLHYSPHLVLEAQKAGVRRVVAKADGGDELLAAIEELLAKDKAALHNGAESSRQTLNGPSANPSNDGSQTKKPTEGNDGHSPKPN